MRINVTLSYIIKMSVTQVCAQNLIMSIFPENISQSPYIMPEVQCSLRHTVLLKYQYIMLSTALIIQYTHQYKKSRRHTPLLTSKGSPPVDGCSPFLCVITGRRHMNSECRSAPLYVTFIQQLPCADRRKRSLP